MALRIQYGAHDRDLADQFHPLIGSVCIDEIVDRRRKWHSVPYAPGCVQVRVNVRSVMYQGVEYLLITAFQFAELLDSYVAQFRDRLREIRTRGEIRFLAGSHQLPK